MSSSAPRRFAIAVRYCCGFVPELGGALEAAGGAAGFGRTGSCTPGSMSVAFP
jgi:hypothetical protein